MNKQEFLNALKNKLSSLDPKEVEDMMNEYGEYIDDKMKDGASETEAVEGFGNIEDLAAEILDAYNVDPKTSNKSEGTPSTPAFDANNAFQTCIHYIQDFFQKTLKGLSTQDILRMLILLVIALFLVKIPFSIIQVFLSFITDILFGTGFFGSLLSGILSLFINILYLIAVVILVITLYNAIHDKKDIEMSELIRSPFRYFNGGKDLDPKTSETIDKVGDTINSAVNTATKSIDEIIANAKKRSVNEKESSSFVKETPPVKEETPTIVEETPIQEEKEDEDDDVIKETFSKQEEQSTAYISSVSKIFNILLIIASIPFWCGCIGAIVLAVVSIAFAPAPGLSFGYGLACLGVFLICLSFIQLLRLIRGKKTHVIGIVLSLAIGIACISVGVGIVSGAEYDIYFRGRV